MELSFSIENNKNIYIIINKITRILIYLWKNCWVQCELFFYHVFIDVYRWDSQQSDTTCTGETWRKFITRKNVHKNSRNKKSGISFSGNHCKEHKHDNNNLVWIHNENKNIKQWKKILLERMEVNLNISKKKFIHNF